MVVDCPACGAPAQAGDRFCRRCGRPLPAGGFPPPSEVPPAAPPSASRLRGSALPLLIIALILLLAATNPSPAAYIAWAAPRLVPAASFVPVREAAYVAVERATVAESYGVCTVFQTRLRSGTMMVIGIMGLFVPIDGGYAPAPSVPPATTPRRQRRGRGTETVQI